jgi:hypothetical protein
MSRRQSTTEDLGIVVRALDLIEPAPHRQDECRCTIESDVRLLKLVHDDSSNSISSAKLRESLSAAVDALTDVQFRIRSLPKKYRSLVFRGLGEYTAPVDSDTYMDATKNLERGIAFLRDHLHVPKGSRPRDPVKQVAALFARDLLRDYSAKKPTLTTEGPYLALASILYESVTGTEGADLRRYCSHPDDPVITHALKIPRVRP